MKLRSPPENSDSQEILELISAIAEAPLRVTQALSKAIFMQTLLESAFDLVGIRITISDFEVSYIL